MYCPGGSWEPSIVSPGYYSIGGDGATTRIGQVRSESKPKNYFRAGLTPSSPDKVHAFFLVLRRLTVVAAKFYSSVALRAVKKMVLA